MKQFLIIILLTILTFASEGATKDDIKLLVNLIKENNRQIDKRLEAIDKRFEDINKRFEDMQKYMDKRFEAVDKRFEDMNSKFNMIVTIMLAGFALIMGYLIKERNSIKKDIKVELEEELNKKADVNLVERVVSVLEEFGRKNSDIEEVLKKHNFIVK